VKVIIIGLILFVFIVFNSNTSEFLKKFTMNNTESKQEKDVSIVHIEDKKEEFISIVNLKSENRILFIL
jgi:hypothetical protein